MELKIRETKRYEVDYTDLEEFIKFVYGDEIDYDFCSDREASNDSVYDFNVCKEKIDGYDQEQLDIFKQGQSGSWMTQTILTDLCNRDLIPEGEYLVTVCW
jgi:hypothetical protein